MSTTYITMVNLEIQYIGHCITWY